MYFDRVIRPDDDDNDNQTNERISNAESIGCCKIKAMFVTVLNNFVINDIYIFSSEHFWWQHKLRKAFKFVQLSKRHYTELN